MVVYLSALSNIATCMLVKSDVLELLVNKLATSSSLQLMIPVMISSTFKVFGSLVAEMYLSTPGTCD